MKKSFWLRNLSIGFLIIIVLLFIFNVFQHGRIKHPGLAVYQSQCAQCHGESGEGIKTLVPPLDDAGFARKHFDSIPCWLKYGLNHPMVVHGKTYDQPMYPGNLDEIQTANVINYLNRTYFQIDTVINSVWVRERWNSCN